MEVDALETKISAMISSYQQVSKATYTAKLAAERSLLEELAILKAEVLSSGEPEIHLRILQAEVKAFGDELDYFADQRTQLLKESEARNDSPVSVALAPVPNSPHSPRPFVSLALSLASGLFLAGLVSSVRDRLDGRIRSDAEEKTLGLPVIARVPSFAVEPGSQDLSTFSDAFAAYQDVWKALGVPEKVGGLAIQVSGVGHGVDKSLSALLLALQSSRAGVNTLLVDADLNNPRLARLLDIECRGDGFAGVNELNFDLRSHIISSVSDSFSVLLCRAGNTYYSPIVASENIGRLLEACREQYGLIILVSPRIPESGGASVIAHHADRGVVVVEAETTRLRDLVHAIRYFNRCEAFFAGAIITNCR